MKETKSSSASANKPKMIVNGDTAQPKATLCCPKISTRETKPRMMICPAVILAKSRIINTNGFVNISISSIAGINGIGNFIHIGTPGVLKVCFQYALVLLPIVIKNVSNARTKVTEILPVILAPKGKKGTMPKKFPKNIKKNKVAR